MKTVAKNQTEVTLRMNIKMFVGNNLPYELLLTKTKKTNLRNTFENNMSADVKLSKVQISKITQCGGFLRSLLSKIAGPLMKAAVPLAKIFFSSIKNTSCCFSNWCMQLKENRWFWNIYFQTKK